MCYKSPPPPLPASQQAKEHATKWENPRHFIWAYCNSNPSANFFTWCWNQEIKKPQNKFSINHWHRCLSLSLFHVFLKIFRSSRACGCYQITSRHARTLNELISSTETEATTETTTETTTAITQIASYRFYRCGKCVGEFHSGKPEAAIDLDKNVSSRYYKLFAF